LKWRKPCACVEGRDIEADAPAGKSGGDSPAHGTPAFMKRFELMKLALLKISLAAAGAAMLAGCAGLREHKGAILDPQLIGAIQPGIDNKDSVAKTLGQPTFAGEFTSNDWYYLSRDTSAFAFRNPRVTDQTVIHVRFDQAGNVAAVERTGKNLVANIDPTKRSTPTLGRKHDIFSEIFGGIGTVGAPGMGNPGSGGPTH
jgi:outer membrane protein assembly factor BamE (lipoprotein component of BamABCDE complex)